MSDFTFSRWSKRFGIAAIGCVITAGSAAATVVAPPVASYYAFQFTNNSIYPMDLIGVELSGDQTSYLPANPNAGYLDSLGGGASANVSTSGTNIIYSTGGLQWPGGASAEVGFTFTAPPNIAPMIISAGGGSQVGNSSPVDLVSFSQGTTTLPTISAADPYAIVSVDVSSANNNPPAQQWYEFSFTSNPTVIFTNNTTNSETLSSAGFFISPTLIPLDQLNAADLPAANFTALPSTLDGTLSAGNSLSYTIPTPEPAALAFFGFGVIALATRRTIRSKAT